jgi:hypothetical protein
MKQLEEYCSDVVDAVHDIFVSQKSTLDFQNFKELYPKMEESAHTKIFDFHQKSQFQNLQQSLKQILSEYPQPLYSQLEKKVDICIDLSEQRKYELEQYKANTLRIQKKCESIKKEHGSQEELELQEQFLQMHLEHGKVKFPVLHQHEQELKDWVSALQQLPETIGAVAQQYQMDKNFALEIAHFILNGQFTMIHESRWDLFYEELSSEDKKLLNTYYSFKNKSGFYECQLHLDYPSALYSNAIIGQKTAKVGPPCSNYLVQRLLERKMKPFYMIDLSSEAKTFYRFVCKEALKDGVLTEHEIEQMLAIASTLGLEKSDASTIMNEVALLVQQDLIYSALLAMFEMANAADGIQKEEQLHILSLKKNYQEKMVHDLGEQFLNNPNSNLELCVTEEGIFVELLKISFKGNDFGKSELDILKKYAQSMNWSEEKLKKVILSTKQELALAK